MIIFFYGPDTFRSRQKLQEIKDKFKKEVDKSGLNSNTLDGAKLEFAEFEQAVSTQPFLAKKRLVIIEELLSKNRSQKIQKEILDLLKKNNLENTILVFWEGQINQPKGKKKKSKAGSGRSDLLFYRLQEEKYAQEFELLKPSETRAWAAAEIKKRGGKIESAALELLADFVGNDLWQLNSEIDKLISYAKDRPIKLADVQDLVKTKLDEDIFKLTDSIGQKNKKLAINLISDQFKSGVAPTELLGRIIWQFKNLLLVKSFVDKNGPGYPAERLSQQLYLHPFVIKKTMLQAKNYNMSDLKKIYSQLTQIDHKIKTTQLDPEIFFDLLVVKI